MTYRLEAQFIYHATESEDPELNVFLDRVDEHLVEGLGCKDVLIASDGASSTFSIALAAEGDDYERAFSAALGTLRTAFHAENCSTPEWPACSELVNAGLMKKTDTRGLITA